ncbi:MAG: histidinol dehydrogenase [Clostridiales bacterium]|jgi:histidinol dehydrogenase|nr:histidinol dehydrogenase [Clostridiales bacterium]
MLKITDAYKKKNYAESYEDKLHTVDRIIKDVRERGDDALFEYARAYDKVDLNENNIRVTEAEIAEAYDNTPPELMSSLLKCKANILKYHERQVKDGEFDGATGWKFVPVSSAGLYVPGGLAAYPSSVLMCALPAVAAGVDDIAVATPSIKNPLILAAAKICGINKIYKIGGAQAIAAFAYGTASVKKVDIIAGPGNIYVTLAKKRVFGDVGIDMLAGPSEICVLADGAANPEYVAHDLLSQAEHGPLGDAVLVATSEAFAERVIEAMLAAAARSGRKSIINDSIENSCQIIYKKNMADALKTVNQIAPEHLEIYAANAFDLSNKIVNAGAIFIGGETPVAVGDYYAGPSHVLPTGGNARFSSVLSVDTFLKRISLIGYGADKLREGADDIIRMAEAEGFYEHAESVRVRLKNGRRKGR